MSKRSGNKYTLSRHALGVSSFLRKRNDADMRRGRFLWTYHAKAKMRYYRLTEMRVKRVIRHPARVEEGIVPRAIAVMQPAGGRRYSEIWVMYMLVTQARVRRLAGEKSAKKQIKVITAWRYPGRAPERDPVPVEILQEIRNSF